MKLLIIEDEVRAVNQLQLLLKACQFQYELLDTLDTVEDAVKWFENHDSPDLVFLDIQLADGLSFEIFQKVKVEAPIIFTTAFDQYAIQAFKVNSVDYLLKPIQEEDLSGALSKFQAQQQPKGLSDDLLKSLLADLQGKRKREGLLVKSGSAFVQVKITDLLYCYSEDSISFGVTGSKRFIIEESLDELFGSLDPQQFFKINRGQIVSKSAIERIEPYFNHRVKLEVQNPRDQEFIVSRPKTSDFKDWMNR